MTLTVAAEPIDTHDYGFLREGQSEEAILDRVGRPDSREVIRTQLNRVGSTLVVVKIERWIYKGDGATMRTVLITENGRLLSKSKMHERE